MSRRPLVAILAGSRVAALRIARRRGIPAALVFWPSTPAALAYIVRQGAEVFWTEELWNHPRAEELANWIQDYLNPHPASWGAPSNLPLLRRGEPLH